MAKLTFSYLYFAFKSLPIHLIIEKYILLTLSNIVWFKVTLNINLLRWAINSELLNSIKSIIIEIVHDSIMLPKLWKQLWQENGNFDKLLFTWKFFYYFRWKKVQRIFFQVVNCYKNENQLNCLISEELFSLFTNKYFRGESTDEKFHFLKHLIYFLASLNKKLRKLHFILTAVKMHEPLSFHRKHQNKNPPKKHFFLGVQYKLGWKQYLFSRRKRLWIQIGHKSWKLLTVRTLTILVIAKNIE